MVDLSDADPEEELVVAQIRRGAGEAEVVGFTLDMGSVYVTNNVPYIRKLNEGSSTQAPAGFVQASIEKAARLI